MVTEGEGAVGSVDVPTEIRKELALKSRNFTCPVCGMSHESLHKKWDKKKPKTDEKEDTEKGEAERSPSESQGISETKEESPEEQQQQTETEVLLTQPPEKLNPMEILRRRRALRMKQKEAETSQKLSAGGTEAEIRDSQEQPQEPQMTEANAERNDGETRPVENRTREDEEEEELILAPEEIIRNTILDKTVVLIILAIIFLELRKWVLSQ